MNKAELINVLASKCAGLSKKQSKEILDCLVTTVIDTLKTGGKVTIAGFGTFSAKQRTGRVGVNPQKPSEKIQIPAVVVPKFKAGKTLKDALKNKR